MPRYKQTPYGLREFFDSIYEPDIDDGDFQTQMINRVPQSKLVNKTPQYHIGNLEDILSDMGKDISAYSNEDLLKFAKEMNISPDILGDSPEINAIKNTLQNNLPYASDDFKNKLVTSIKYKQYDPVLTMDALHNPNYHDNLYDELTDNPYSFKQDFDSDYGRSGEAYKSAMVFEHPGNSEFYSRIPQYDPNHESYTNYLVKNVLNNGYDTNLIQDDLDLMYAGYPETTVYTIPYAERSAEVFENLSDEDILEILKNGYAPIKFNI